MKQRMEHPNLPGQAIYVRKAAVPSHRRSGWREAPEPTPEPEQIQQEQEQPRKSRRGRVTQQEDSHGAEPA